MFIGLTYENQWNFHTKSPAVYSVTGRKLFAKLYTERAGFFLFIHNICSKQEELGLNAF